MDLNRTQICHRWMMDTYTKKNVTIAEVNDRLILRFLGGIFFLSLVVIVGMIGNTHVLYIYYAKFKRSNYKIYVIWLALIDLFNCSVSAPFVIYYLMHPVSFPSEIFCKVFRFILYFCGATSTASLIPIVIDRGRRVLAPLKPQITHTQAKLMCGASVLVGLALTWPVPILFGLQSEPTGVPGLMGRRCLKDDRFTSPKAFVMFNLALIIYFWLVTTSLVIVYFLVARQIYRSSVFNRQYQASTPNTSEADLTDISTLSNRSVQRSTITLIMVTSVYIISAAIFHILSMIFFFDADFDCNLSLAGSVVFYTFIWSYFVNNACNPFIYSFRDITFRKEVKLLYKI